MTKEQAIKDLTNIPGVGKSLATDLWNIGITPISGLKGKNPDKLYDLSNAYAESDNCRAYQTINTPT